MSSVNSVILPRAPEVQKREIKRAPDSNTSRESVLSLMVLGNDQPVNRDSTDISKEIKLKTELSQQQAENIYLKQRNEEAPEIQDTINRIITDKPYWFDLYKAKSQKLRLLDEAIHSHDGNAIIAVTLFAKRTLITDIFLIELLSRPVALTHYLAHLEQMKSFDEIIEIYRVQGKLEDAAVTEYRKFNHLSEKSDDKAKLNTLKYIKEYIKQLNFLI